MEPAALALAPMERFKQTQHLEEFAKLAHILAILAVDQRPTVQLALRLMVLCSSQITVVLLIRRVQTVLIQISPH